MYTQTLASWNYVGMRLGFGGFQPHPPEGKALILY